MMSKALWGQFLIILGIFLFGYIHAISLIMNIGIGLLIGMGSALIYVDIREDED
jgi:hypothetical protein